MTSYPLSARKTGPTRPPAIDFVDPYTHDNARLIAQEGVFTRAPDGVAIEEWVRTHTEPGERFVHLLRIETPDADRKAALSQLAEMRITHSNLFPDAAGAAFDANYWYESEGELPDFLHRESLHPTESASRHNADAPTGASVDAARSTLRTDRPLQARGKPLTAKYTYTPRDRDGKILSDVDWTVTVERVGPLANPFFADATSSDPTS